MFKETTLQFTRVLRKINEYDHAYDYDYSRGFHNRDAGGDQKLKISLVWPKVIRVGYFSIADIISSRKELPMR